MIASRLPSSRPDVDAELTQIAREPKALLRERYRTLFGCEPPKAFGPDLLRRSVAYRLQENAYGGLSKPIDRSINKLIEAYLADPPGTLKEARQTQTGVVLVREWQDKSHQVTILDEGFAYGGRHYASLSEIAREITGTRWNGPRFFGLRKRPLDRQNLERGAQRDLKPAMRSKSLAEHATIRATPKRVTLGRSAPRRRSITTASSVHGV